MRYISDTFNNKNVRYAPGRLIVCKKIEDSEEYCNSLIESFGCRTLEYHLPGVFEVFVNPEITLETANNMLESNYFRFVQLNTVETF